VGVLQGTQDVTRKRMHHGNRPGTPVERLLQSLALDPVSHPKGQIADDPRVVDVADGGMVQPAQRLGLAKEPGPNRRIDIEVHPQADPALEDKVVRLELYLVRRDADCALQAIARAQGLLGALEVPKRLGGGQRSSPRRRSTLASRPHTDALHQRRL
jgi:hypothetical protein